MKVSRDDVVHEPAMTVAMLAVVPKARNCLRFIAGPFNLSGSLIESGGPHKQEFGRHTSRLGLPEKRKA